MTRPHPTAADTRAASEVRDLLVGLPDNARHVQREVLMRAVAAVVQAAGLPIPDAGVFRRARYYGHNYNERPLEQLRPSERLHRLLLSARDWSDPEWPSALAEIVTDAGFPLPEDEWMSTSTDLGMPAQVTERIRSGLERFNDNDR